MGSWVSCTVGPVDGVSAQELRSKLLGDIPEEVAVCANGDPSGRVPPFQYREKYRVLSTRISPHRECSPETLRERLREWIEPHTSDLDVVYLVAANDTSDRAEVDVYGAVDGRLARVASREGEVAVHPLRLENGEHFPEHALVLYESDNTESVTRPNLSEVDDVLDEFQEEFGCRPMVHYDGTAEV